MRCWQSFAKGFLYKLIYEGWGREGRRERLQVETRGQCQVSLLRSQRLLETAWLAGSWAVSSYLTSSNAGITSTQPHVQFFIVGARNQTHVLMLAQQAICKLGSLHRPVFIKLGLPSYGRTGNRDVLHVFFLDATVFQLPAGLGKMKSVTPPPHFKRVYILLL